MENVTAAERFDRAADAARKTSPHLRASGTVERYTVLNACDAYVRKVRSLKGDKAAYDLDGRYRRWVSGDPIHRVEVGKLTREQVSNFRQRIVAAPVNIGRSSATRERSKDTVNRDIAAVRAALNMAIDDCMALSDLAWKKPLAAFKNVSRRRELYLDREERIRLIQSAGADLAQFIRGLSMLPLRPGALASLTVADLDVRVGVLKIGTDKSGKDRRLKLPAVIADFLNTAAGDRPSTSPLFARSDGNAWNRDSWKKPLKAASLAAKLPAGTIAYTLRHSAISDLVHSGLDLLTVAQISGTSVAMIERHYGHPRSDVAAAALAKLVL